MVIKNRVLKVKKRAILNYLINFLTKHLLVKIKQRKRMLKSKVDKKKIRKEEKDKHHSSRMKKLLRKERKKEK